MVVVRISFVKSKLVSNCSGNAWSQPLDSTRRIAAWFIDFSTSSVLLRLRTNPMSDIILDLKRSLAAAISSIILFSEVREPLEITSKRHLLSVRSCTGT